MVHVFCDHVHQIKTHTAQHFSVVSILHYEERAGMGIGSGSTRQYALQYASSTSAPRPSHYNLQQKQDETCNSSPPGAFTAWTESKGNLLWSFKKFLLSSCKSLVNRSGNLGGFLQGGKRHILNTKAELLPNYKSLLQSLGALEHQRKTPQYSHTRKTAYFSLASFLELNCFGWNFKKKIQPKADIWTRKSQFELNTVWTDKSLRN